MEGAERPQRRKRSMRLAGYDYGQAGAYFVTICTHKRQCLLARIDGGEARLTDLGRLVEGEWLRTPSIRPNVSLDLFVTMPNHFHAILVIETPVAGKGTSRSRGTGWVGAARQW